MSTLNKIEQLKDMIDNYGGVLAEQGLLDEVIIYMSGQIYEANKARGYAGYNFDLDYREQD